MSNNSQAYEGMGSILARLPFHTSLKSIYSGAVTEGEQEALRRALQAAVSLLIRSRQYYELEDDAVESCAAGFASALAQIVLFTRGGIQAPRKTMQVDGYTWELVFDPGPKSEHWRTDEKGRVWNKVISDQIDDYPF